MYNILVSASLMLIAVAQAITIYLLMKNKPVKLQPLPSGISPEDQVKVEVANAYEILKRHKHKLMLDPTKRSTMTPGTSPGPIAGEMDEVLSEEQQVLRAKIEQYQKAEREMFVPSSAHADLQHNFFGTTVTIGKWSKSGLDKRLHVLEVINNQLYIDQQPIDTNPSDLENIKQVLQAALKVEAQMLQEKLEEVEG